MLVGSFIFCQSILDLAGSLSRAALGKDSSGARWKGWGENASLLFSVVLCCGVIPNFDGVFSETATS